jgi:hypothetical protein
MVPRALGHGCDAVGSIEHPALPARSPGQKRSAAPCRIVAPSRHATAPNGAIEELERGGLARAVRAEKPEHLGGPDFERETVEPPAPLGAPRIRR